MSERYALSVRVSRPPPRPTLLYDATCEFCTYWARRWAQNIGASLALEALQHREGRYLELSQQELENAVHLVDSQGRVWRGAAAVFRAAALRRRYAIFWWGYRRVPGARWLSEWIYAWVANHRMTVSRLTRWMRRDRPDDSDAC
ncbi:hypothetical protein DL240_05275 [Lujinxingia litoralis]|uniref:DUF393 domain-containing protein n=1 Tax=Lujinxingia litoralis TaxID=2211119 RepID=A0A328CCG3_9DELT|nr:DCC1-like thiol-disulfide oxidoreductase family protein [Lujinxingia litoralis]RAL23571.1 hypothetical protein DL240_05275 [Lujinxingia litoralis]